MLLLLVPMLLASAPLPESGWKQVVSGEVAISTRAKPGARIEEMKAEMVMPASPAEVRAVLIDDDYTSKTPYVSEARVISHGAPNVWVKYTRLDFPIVEDRDYFIEITRQQDLAADGSGVYHAVWRPWGLDRPAREGIVRVTTNEGYWDVRPEGDGAHSHVTYYLLSDPGGNIPAWLVDRANRSVMPDVLRNLEKEILRRKSEPARAAPSAARGQTPSAPSDAGQ